MINRATDFPIGSEAPACITAALETRQISDEAKLLRARQTPPFFKPFAAGNHHQGAHTVSVDFTTVTAHPRQQIRAAQCPVGTRG